MRKSATGLMIFVAVSAFAPRADASGDRFGFGSDIANAPAQPHTSPSAVIGRSPEFIVQPAMGYHTAAGTPRNLFSAGNRHYLCCDETRYAIPNYNGPWVTGGDQTVPGSFRRYPIDGIRPVKDEGPGYHLDDDNYGDRHFRPEWIDWRDEDGRGEREKPVRLPAVAMTDTAKTMLWLNSRED